MREEGEELSCYGPEDDYLLLPEEREIADFWRQERRNEVLMQENRTREFWARRLADACDPDDPYSDELY